MSAPVFGVYMLKNRKLLVGQLDGHPLPLSFSFLDFFKSDNMIKNVSCYMMLMFILILLISLQKKVRNLCEGQVDGEPSPKF